MVKTGHLFDKQHPDLYKKWVIGSFVSNPDFHSDDFEFKFQTDKKGSIRQAKEVLHTNTISLEILIDGQVRMNFDGQDLFLKERGDYLWWTPDQPHLFECLEDSLVITLRWFNTL